MTYNYSKYNFHLGVIMAKRQKTVFSSHAQVAHIWAQQIQEHGRASRVFFENTTDIYSYGRHYIAGRIHTVDGKQFALIRRDPYSVSTAKHLREIERAVRGLMPYFEVAGGGAVRDVALAVADQDAQVTAAIDRALARKYFADSSWRVDTDGGERGHHVEAIQRALNIANKLRGLVGLAPIAMPEKYAAALAHLDKLQASYMSQKRVAKRRAAAEERERQRVAYAKKNEERSKEQIENFRAGKGFGYINLPYDLLRISNDGRDVQTSGGAEVPLYKARRLLAAIEEGKRNELAGQKIGAFTVELFADDADTGEEYVKIGCHRILLAEARRVLNGAPCLKLVGGA